MTIDEAEISRLRKRAAAIRASNPAEWRKESLILEVTGTLEAYANDLARLQSELAAAPRGFAEGAVAAALSAYEGVINAAFEPHQDSRGVKMLAMETALHAAIEAAGLQIIDTRTHWAAPVEATEAMVDAGTAADWVGECESRAGASILPASEQELAEAMDYYLDGDELPLRYTSPGIWAAMRDAYLAEQKGEG